MSQKEPGLPMAAVNPTDESQNKGIQPWGSLVTPAEGGILNAGRGRHSTDPQGFQLASCRNLDAGSPLWIPWE